MRLSFILLLLPASTLAQNQKPLKEKAAEWFDMAKSYISAAAPPSPIDAGAAKVAGFVVEEITNTNWRTKMLPTAGDPNRGPQEWMIMFSGNSSCYGRCEQPDQVFNVRARSIQFHVAVLDSNLFGYIGKCCATRE